MPLETVSTQGEFALVITRRRADGGIEPVAIVEYEALVDRAIHRAAI
jgi:hypothetical protein